MFNLKNFKFNLDGLICYLIANLLIMANVLICIQYGIEGIDKILLFITATLSIRFLTKSLQEWGL